ncbi:MAG TPA: Uma2 family endonuclease [Chthoniobacterales bacterium]
MLYIFVEILSPSNTEREIGEKISLYFESGAKEVWICDKKGAFEFRLRGRSSAGKISKIFPGFPKNL